TGRERARYRWFFLESHYPKVFIDFNHTEMRGIGERMLNRGNCHICIGLDMRGQQFPVIHLIDMIAGQYHHILRRVGVNDSQILKDCIGRSSVPLTAYRRQANQLMTTASGNIPTIPTLAPPLPNVELEV